MDKTRFSILNSESHQVPARLFKPMWLRSRESLIDDGLVYDPIAARACAKCAINPECLSGNVSQSQLLHVTLTHLCDLQIKHFLDQNPEAWVINIGAGLDTRFYRLDNGRCHWIELDVTEHLLWREQLFHRCERYKHHNGSVEDLSWLSELKIPEDTPVLLVSEMALLDCNHSQITQLLQALGRHFLHANTCFVLAGDKCDSPIGHKFGTEPYQHGFENPAQSMLNGLPWAKVVKQISPLDQTCMRWKWWQKCLAKSQMLKYRYTPVVVSMQW
ncbi:class I SAM-dependent methyltransferase [Vibrio maerlii]|uniref:class I SAM-dependent methyltransferase n=1 Tax=Vibrio maerlii TaxID=2231648 RepID=UPI000E3B97F3|nr:class I SAM-dependent methyltransferase [Vibrio maerlii]